jgi:hypothetical protein
MTGVLATRCTLSPCPYRAPFNAATLHVLPLWICRYAKGYWPKGGTSSTAAPAASAAAAGPEPLMLKVKDWPPGQDFRGELPRHMMVRTLARGEHAPHLLSAPLQVQWLPELDHLCKYSGCQSWTGASTVLAELGVTHLTHLAVLLHDHEHHPHGPYLAQQVHTAQSLTHPPTPLTIARSCQLNTCYTRRPPSLPVSLDTPLQDFVERLPLRAYTDPRLGRGPLNLATCLLPDDNPTDLGPKGYLAYGRCAARNPCLLTASLAIDWTLNVT